MAEIQDRGVFILKSTAELCCLTAAKARSFNIKNSIRGKLWR
jgi:hypothetical protein